MSTEIRCRCRKCGKALKAININPSWKPRSFARSCRERHKTLIQVFLIPCKGQPSGTRVKVNSFTPGGEL